jgi:hypothetical protein
MKQVRLFIKPFSLTAVDARCSSQLLADKTIFSLWFFVTKEKTNRHLLCIALVATILQFMLFKWLYPYPDFVPDSYTYIYAATAHLDISIQPIAYSKFLAIFHSLTHSDVVVIAFQYFLLEGAALFLFFSILIFHTLSRATRTILFIFLFLNPLFLYIGNYIDNISLFIALSILWFTQMLWLIRRPSWGKIFILAVLVFFCVAIKNNAYYYLTITAIGILLTPSKPLFKLAGILAPFLLILPFMMRNREEARKITNTAQPSLNRGWELANNSLYMRSHILIDSMALPTAEIRQLDGMVREFYKHIWIENLNDYLAQSSGIFFIEDSRAPLKQFLNKHFYTTDRNQSIAAWGKASAVFKGYGCWLIRHYPLSFVHYFILPNIRNYFIPPLGSMESYNQGADETALVVQDWFDYTTPAIPAVSKTLQGNILLPFPYLFLLMQILYVGGIILWSIEKRFKFSDPAISRSILLGALFWALNFFHSLFVGPIVLRDQLSSMILTGVYVLLLIELIDNKETIFNSLVLTSPEVHIPSKNEMQ